MNSDYILRNAALMTAVISAVPLLIGMVIFALTSHETRSRRLEEISQAEFMAVRARSW